MAKEGRIFTSEIPEYTEIENRNKALNWVCSILRILANNLDSVPNADKCLNNRVRKHCLNKK